MRIFFLLKFWKEHNTEKREREKKKRPENTKPSTSHEEEQSEATVSATTGDGSFERSEFGSVLCLGATRVILFSKLGRYETRPERPAYRLFFFLGVAIGPNVTTYLLFVLIKKLIVFCFLKISFLMKIWFYCTVIQRNHVYVVYGDDMKKINNKNIISLYSGIMFPLFSKGVRKRKV